MMELALTQHGLHKAPGLAQSSGPPHFAVDYPPTGAAQGGGEFRGEIM